MIPQTLDMFDEAKAEPPIFRKSDPKTSQQAGIVYNETARASDKQTMRQLIIENPGLTAGEYGQILLGRSMKPMKAIRMTTKRISDLKKDNELVVGPARKCTISGRRASVYYFRNP